MKAIIEGRRYDTEKADKIGEISGRALAEDVAESGAFAWTESLYMTPAGRFFLCGSGAPGTRWFRTAPPENRVEAGDQVTRWALRALNEEKAQAWVEKYCSAEVYEQLWDVEDA